MLNPGTYLQGRYEILEKIGSGGMSVVYKAKCHTLNRLVAIKVLKEEFASDENFVSKFKMEAQAAARLSIRLWHFIMRKSARVKCLIGQRMGLTSACLSRDYW